MPQGQIHILVTDFSPHCYRCLWRLTFMDSGGGGGGTEQEVMLEERNAKGRCEVEDWAWAARCHLNKSHGK